MQNKDWNKVLKINHNQIIAMYYQIAQNITALYKEGIIIPGEKLPSEWELSEIYKVSRLTVRQALKELEGAGLIKRKPGIGTFVSSPTTTNIYPSKLGFTQKIINLGKTPSSKIITIKHITGSEEVCKKLNLSENSQVIELVRIRYADNSPVMVDNAYLSADQFPDLTEESLGGGSLYEFLAKYYGVTIVSVEQELRPVLLDKQQAKYLNLVIGSPAMHSEVIAFSKDQNPVDYSVSIFNGEICRFYFRYREEGN